METALMEITLVVLTTLAPAGIVAYAALAVWLVASRSPEECNAVSHWLIVPLVFPLLGFVASATHLGTPANALYVLTGIGRSPLSGEVAAIVVFLILGGCYWIVSFGNKPIGSGKRAFLCAVIASALIALFFISRAYSVWTIPTWDMPLAPVTLWMDGLSSGPALVVLTFLCARVFPEKRVFTACVVVTVVSSIVNICCLAGETAVLPGIQTTVAAASDLVPNFIAMIVLYAAFELASIVGLVVVSRRVQVGVASKKRYGMAVAVSAGALACACLACFFVRFWFYCMYMTVGL